MNAASLVNPPGFVPPFYAARHDAIESTLSRVIRPRSAERANHVFLLYSAAGFVASLVHGGGPASPLDFARSAMAFVFLGLFTLASFAVGIRLLMRGLSEKTRPETLLGAHALLIASGNVIVQGAVLVGLHGTKLASSVVRTGGVIVDAGYACFAWFCVDVYRPEMPGLRKLSIALLIAITVVQPIGVFFEATVDPIFYSEQVLRVASYAWGSYEAFRFYAIMRRRARYGMGDPMVENRFLLWGAATTMALLILIAMCITFKLTALSKIGAWTLTAGAILTVPTGFLVWLAFFPPDWYRKRVERKLGGSGA